MTGVQPRPLYVAGVAGGVGTSTWTRAFRREVALPVVDLGVFVTYLARVGMGRGIVDVLVTSNTAAAASQLGGSLARCERPPLLVVMHTVPGGIATTRAYLRQAQPHVTRQFDVSHQQRWLEMDQPPGHRIPKEFRELVLAVPAALEQMYRTPVESTPGSSLTRAAVSTPLITPAGHAARTDHRAMPSGNRAPHPRHGPHG